MLEDPEDPVWPTRCRVTVRGLPPGVSAKEFYTKLDASVFCRVLMDGTPQKTHMDRQRDTWACELEFNVAPLMWMDPRLMALPEVPMYSALEFGTPTAYLILLCWRHVPFLFHLHPSFHHAVVGPGPGDVTHFARLMDCVTSFCERRLEMYGSGSSAWWCSARRRWPTTSCACAFTSTCRSCGRRTRTC